MSWWSITAIFFFSLFIFLTIVFVSLAVYKRSRAPPTPVQSLQNRETQVVHIPVSPGAECPIYQTRDGQIFQVMRLEPAYPPMADQNARPHLQTTSIPPSYQEVSIPTSVSTGQGLDNQKKQFEMNQLGHNSSIQKNEDTTRKDAY